METSAKNGFNVNKLFCQVGKILYEEFVIKNKVNRVRIYLFNKFINELQSVDPEVENEFKLSMENNKKKKFKFC